MAPKRSTSAQSAASASYNIRTKMTPIRNTPSQPAASCSQIVTKDYKDGAEKQHSIPACRVQFPNCFKIKQRWRPKSALQPSLPRHIPSWLQQEKTKMTHIRSTPAQSAASFSYNIKTKMAPIRNTPAQPAALIPKLLQQEKTKMAHIRSTGQQGLLTIRHWMEDFAEVMLAAKKTCQWKIREALKKFKNHP
jgi:hypothetical protein